MIVMDGHMDNHLSDQRVPEEAPGPSEDGLVLQMVGSKDLGNIISWYRVRNLPSPPSWSLSKYGLMVPGVAAGFLYRTDSGLALVEGLITNPDAPSMVRGRALELVLRNLVAVARDMGFHMVLGFVQSSGSAALARRCGLREVGKYIGLAIDLED